MVSIYWAPILPAKLCAEHFIESSLPPIYGVDTAPILILQMTHLRLKGSSDPGSHTQPISSRVRAKGLYDSKTWAYRCDSQIRLILHQNHLGSKMLKMGFPRSLSGQWTQNPGSLPQWILSDVDKPPTTL